MADIDVKSTIKSLGIVFGDIGTSPIYTFTVIALFVKPTHENILGISSLIAWTLIIVVTLKYVCLAMSLSEKGEGGTIVLLQILTKLCKPGRKLTFATMLGYVGISLLFGDSVITPSISILSAVEGMRLLPVFHDINQHSIILIAGLIACILLVYQKRGTDKVAMTFSPVMLIWFICLAYFGICYILKYPAILHALNPYHSMLFIYNNKLASFFALSNVILCATGGEALYADMGHLRRKPITQAWGFVFTCLVLNYLGQGAFFILNPGATNILFGMAYNQARLLYVPFLILTIFATVIASQAMISGIFSVVYQGITTRIFPIFKVDFKSDKIKGQIYVDFINWFLLVAILFVMVIFKNSENLAAAYGVAVTGDMIVTSILMVLIFSSRKNYFRFAICIFLLLIDIAFVSSTLLKVPAGGYCSIILAGIPLTIILIYTYGQKRLFVKLNPYPLKEFLTYYKDAYSKLNKINGSCIFMIKDVNYIPPYIVHTILKNEIIYEDNILLSIDRTENPWEIDWNFRQDIAPGLRHFEITLGYMEITYIEAILRAANIKEKAIFYGLEEISAHKMQWRIFAFIKKLAPSYVYFYKFPPSKLHGVVTRVRM